MTDIEGTQIVDLRWLSAAEGDVEAAIAEMDKEARPQGQPRNQALVFLNLGLLLVYFGVVWIVFAEHIDASAQPAIEPNAIRNLMVAMAIFGIWVYGTRRLNNRLRRPRRGSRMRASRAHLTGLANDVTPEPVLRATFASLITSERRTARCYPRFVAAGVEFGNLQTRTHSKLRWHYVTVTLPAPLPHLLFEASQAADLPSEFPRPRQDQRLPVGGQFDRAFQLYAPDTYERDALFVLTPVVMAALVDHASDFHLEIVDDRLIFFTSALADFSEPEAWQSVDSLLRKVVPELVARAERYRDQRVPEQTSSRRIDALRSAITSADSTWIEPEPRVGQAGLRLQDGRRRLRRSRIREGVGIFVGGYIALAVVALAAVPFFVAISKVVAAFTGG